MKLQRIAALLLTALFAVVLACGSPEERIARHLERARIYNEQAQPQKALIELQSALKLDPKNFEINLLTADVLVELERMEDALFYYEEALRLDPAREEPALGVAQLLLFRDTERADRLIEGVLERNPGNPIAHVMRSDVWLIRKDPDAALASAFTAVELDPRNPRTALQVAAVRKAFVAERTQRGEDADPKHVAEAEAAFANAMAIAREERQIGWIVRATIEQVQLMALQEDRGADIAELFRSSAELLQGYPREEGKLLATARRFARGAEQPELERWALERSVEIAPGDYRAWKRLADISAEQGGDPFAVMQRMVTARSDDPRAHTSYAEFLSANGRNADAIAHLEGLLAEDDVDDSVLSGLTTLYLFANDLDGASRVLERLRSDHPDSVQTYFAEATLANAEGRIPDAIEVLERWTEKQESPRALEMLATARFRTGNPRGALDAIDRAIAASPRTNRSHQRLRGRILVALGDYPAALQAFANSRAPGRKLPIQYMPDVARALYGLGRDDAAAKALARALEVERPAPAALMLAAREQSTSDPIAARAALERGAALYPTLPAFVAALVTSELRAGQIEEALDRARGAVERMPDSAQLQTTLTRTLVAAERMDEAVAQVETVRQRWPGQVGVAELYLEVMTRAGRGDQGFQVLAEQHAAGNLAPEGRVLLARLHVSRGEDETAIRLLRTALADQPGMASAQNDLAYLLARRGESLPEATELAQEARANRPDSSEIADTLGFVYLRRALGEAALVQFDAAVELAEPESTAWATAQYHRGLALRELGRHAEAIAAIEQALASGAEFLQAQEAHGVLAELAGTEGAAPGS